MGLEVSNALSLMLYPNPSPPSIIHLYIDLESDHTLSIAFLWVIKHGFFRHAYLSLLLCCLVTLASGREFACYFMDHVIVLDLDSLYY